MVVAGAGLSLAAAGCDKRLVASLGPRAQGATEEGFTRLLAGLGGLGGHGCTGEGGVVLRDTGL